MNIQDIIITKTAKSVQVSFPDFIVGNTDITGRIVFFTEVNCTGEIINVIEQPIPQELQSKRISEVVAWLFEQNNITVV